MRVTPWFPRNTYPVRAGLYERDWRFAFHLPENGRIIALDLWELVPYKDHFLYPGVWYVMQGLLEASHQNLPWRGLAEKT